MTSYARVSVVEEVGEARERALSRGTCERKCRKHKISLECDVLLEKRAKFFEGDGNRNECDRDVT